MAAHEHPVKSYGPHTCHRRSTRGAGCGMALLAATVGALAGCQPGPVRAIVPPHAVVPPRATATDIKPAPAQALEPAGGAPGGGYYDWHALLIAPFGTVLKEIPLALHDVLLFRDEAHAAGSDDAASAVAAECYAADTPAPIFAGRTPHEYLLCFTRDRLTRIQASVRLTAAEASGVFAAACAEWLKNASDNNTDDCEGRAGAVRFSGRLGQDADRPDMEPAQSTLSITLDGVSVP